MNSSVHRLASLLLCVWIGLEVKSSGETLPEATVVWTLKFPGAFNNSRSTPAIAPDGTLYLGTFQGKLLAITPHGDVKWTYDVNCEIKSSPAIAADGMVYFGSRNRQFYAVTPEGKLKWQFSTGGWVDSSPAIAADGTIYFGSLDKKFYALNPDGTERWEYAVKAIVDSSPAIDAAGTIYFGAHDNKLYALNASGGLRWSFMTGGPIISSPAIAANGAIYFSSMDGNLYAVNPSGTELWHTHTGSTTESSPVLDADGNVCIGINTRTQVFTAEGKSAWGFGSAIPMNVSQVAIGQQFYFSTPWRQLKAMLRDGQSAWQLDLPSNISASLTVGADGRLFLVAETFLYAVQPPGQVSSVAKSSWPMFRANARHTGRVGG